MATNSADEDETVTALCAELAFPRSTGLSLSQVGRSRVKNTEKGRTIERTTAVRLHLNLKLQLLSSCPSSTLTLAFLVQLAQGLVLVAFLIL